MSNKIKWGILGYAQIAQKALIPAILRSSNSELHAIASSNPERLAKCREEIKYSRYYSNYDDLLDDPDVQAVYIPLPNSLHKEWTIKAARKGKHVLCEKPIALNAGDCLEMIEECKQNNVNLMEAFMYRYTARTKKVLELLNSGAIGQVRHINSTFGFKIENENDVRLNSGLGGGSLYDVGCYPVNFFGMITNSSPVSMSAEYIVHNDVDIMFSAVLKYENDIICTLNSWFNAYVNTYSEISGTKGIIRVPDTFFDNRGTITLTTENGTEEIKIPESDRYRLEVEDFADSIISNRQPMFSLNETVRNMRIIEDLMKLVK